MTRLRAAAEHGVAVEVNGQPDRLDLDDARSRRATAAGVSLACNSDAHSVRQLGNMRYAVATARRGWVERGVVLNALPLNDLLSFLNRRSLAANEEPGATPVAALAGGRASAR